MVFISHDEKRNRFDDMKKFMLILICFSSCQKESMITESDKLSMEMNSTHLVYHYSGSDVTKVDTAWQENYIKILLDSLDIKLSEKLHFYKYRDRDHLHRVHGRATNGFAEPGTLKFHTIWPTDNHECVHNLIIKYFGHPPALWNEGIAVAFQFNYLKYYDKQARWNGVLLPDWSKQFLQQNKIPAIDSLITSLIFSNTIPISHILWQVHL